MTRNPFPQRPDFGGFGLGGSPPRDLLVLLGILVLTLALSVFETTRVITDLLSLTPYVWQRGFVWQLATYPFIGAGGPGFGFLLSLLFLYMFGKDVYFGLYRRHFWRLIVATSIGAGAAAAAAHAVLYLLRVPVPLPFAIMQGQYVLLSIFIAAFATAHRDTTIYLFFILPVPARWMFAVEILFAFMAFLGTRDLPGFVGICTAVGLAYTYVRSSGSLRGGRKTFRELRLRMERWWIQRKLDRERRKRGLRVIPGDRGRGEVRKGPWVN